MSNFDIFFENVNFEKSPLEDRIARIYGNLFLYVIEEMFFHLTLTFLNLCSIISAIQISLNIETPKIGVDQFCTFKLKKFQWERFESILSCQQQSLKFDSWNKKDSFLSYFKFQDINEDFQKKSIFFVLTSSHQNPRKSFKNKKKSMKHTLEELCNKMMYNLQNWNTVFQFFQIDENDLQKSSDAQLPT